MIFQLAQPYICPYRMCVCVLIPWHNLYKILNQAWYKFSLYVGEARLRHRQLANSKRGELVELVDSLKDFRVNFKNGFLSSSDEDSDDISSPCKPKMPVLTEADALQKIAQLQIKSNYLESNRRAGRSLSTREKNTHRPPLGREHIASKSPSVTSHSFSITDSKRNGFELSHACPDTLRVKL